MLYFVISLFNRLFPNNQPITNPVPVRQMVLAVILSKAGEPCPALGFSQAPVVPLAWGRRWDLCRQGASVHTGLKRKPSGRHSHNAMRMGLEGGRES
jgi:hypothetical protein